MKNSSFLISHLFDVLKREEQIDETDWLIVNQYAQKWKLSVTDAILDLHFVDDTRLARCLALASGLRHCSGQKISFDFSGVTPEQFASLLSVGAAPLHSHELALYNPYDDQQNNLHQDFRRRENVITERSIILDSLKKHSLSFS